jgi:hypothetical protein
MRRQQKEQAERERLRQENERRREKEEEDALDKVRKSAAEPAPATTPASLAPATRAEAVKAAEASETDSGSPGHSAGQEKAAAERERQRLREQERRRREAVSLMSHHPPRCFFHMFLCTRSTRDARDRDSSIGTVSILHLNICSLLATRPYYFRVVSLKTLLVTSLLASTSRLCAPLPTLTQLKLILLAVRFQFILHGFVTLYITTFAHIQKFHLYSFTASVLTNVQNIHTRVRTKQ